MTQKKAATRQKKTAAELMAKLNADPKFIAKRERRDAELAAREANQRSAEAPLVDELNAAGFAVSSVWDLARTSKPYPEALPILVSHLQRPYPSRVREGIARALAVPDARFAWDVLIRLYREEQTFDAKQGLAVAIAAAADDGVMDDVIDLTRAKQHGSSRGLLLRALGRSTSERARAALMDLATDPELKKEVEAIMQSRSHR